MFVLGKALGNRFGWKMSQRALAFSFIFIFLAVSLFSEEVPQNIFPRHLEFKNFSRPKEIEHYGEESLSDYLKDGSRIFLQYGFIELFASRYTLNLEGVKKEISLELYRMDSPQDAFGIFSTKRTGEERISRQIAALNWVSETQINLVKGEYFINILGINCEAMELEQFAALISQRIKEDIKPFPLLACLPSLRIIPGSRRYLRGGIAASAESIFLDRDFWDFDQSTKAVSAIYKPSNSKLVIIDFETKKEDLEERVMELFEQNLGEVLKKDGIIQGRNSYGNYFLFAQEGNKAFFILDEPNMEFAQILLSQAMKNAKTIQLP